MSLMLGLRPSVNMLPVSQSSYTVHTIQQRRQLSVSMDGMIGAVVQGNVGALMPMNMF